LEFGNIILTLHNNTSRVINFEHKSNLRQELNCVMKQTIIILLIILMMGLIGLLIYTLIPEKSIPKNARITKILVLKNQRKLILFENDQEIKTYKISLGFQPIGHKQFEGDGKTPEGLYTINDKNSKSAYHLNLGISYPNEKDKAYANSKNKNPGGDIKIHGLKNNMINIGKLHRFKDWTLGCIALTNSEIEELFNHVEKGTPIEIRK